jgi:hypothetical protein
MTPTPSNAPSTAFAVFMGLVYVLGTLGLYAALLVAVAR